MEYRRLGNTDLYLSILGFGTSPFGNVYSVVDDSEDAYTVHCAIDSGINFFDVSPYYGSTLAEQRLGKALLGRRNDVIVATKCGRYGADDFDFSAERVTQSIDESLKRLHTDFVDLLQIHDVEFGSFEQIVDETLPALRKIQETGKARYIGITGYPLEMLGQIVENTPVDAVLSYCRYNLMISDLNESLVPITSRRGVGLINASCLGMGLLTEQGPPAWHPAPPVVREAAKKAVKLCHERNEKIENVALKFCIDYKPVSSTLVGMTSPQQVKENVQAITSPLQAELLAELRDTLAPVFNYVWASGLPENQDASADVGALESKLVNS